MDNLVFPRSANAGCAECAAPLAHGQRYCLQCGARSGPPRVDALVELGLADPLLVGEPVAPTVVPYADPPRRPSRVLVALLAAGALTVGGALGATVHGPATSLAASAGPIVALDETAPAAATPTVPAADATTSDHDGLDRAPADDAVIGEASAADDLYAADADPTPATDSGPTGTPTPAAGSPTPAPSPSPSPSPSGSPTPAPAPAPTAPATGIPKIGHVWVVALTGQDLASAFDDLAAAPYLAGALVPQGTLLTEYRAVGAGQLANGVALLSGQAPNADTEADCPVPSDVTPGTIDPATGLVAGVGCFYPSSVVTLPAQLTAAGRTWRAYLGGLPNPCPPAAGVPDAPGYDPVRNAFAAFHGLADPGGAACVPGESDLAALTADLAKPANLSWIVPSACESGAPDPCTDGAPAGVAALDAFLQRVVPAIQASTAYGEDGLIVVTSDVGPPSADGQPAGPVGALLLGPGVRAGARVATPADHYSLLRTLQTIFSLAPTGHAADPGRTAFGADVWRPAPPSTAAPTTTTTRSRHGGRIASINPVP